MAHALEFKFLDLIQIFWMKFKFYWIESNIQLKINKMQIGAQGIENMFIIAIVYNYGVEKNQFLKNTFLLHLN
jgi:hypothetical protein